MRGKDRNWYVVKYLCNVAYYANCKCGFRYICGSSIGDMGVRTIYPYCPNCGAKKKTYNKMPVQLQAYPY